VSPSIVANAKWKCRSPWVRRENRFDAVDMAKVDSRRALR
jgi:hypothetical protein